PGAHVHLVRGGDHLVAHPRVRRLRTGLQPQAAARWTVFVSSARRQGPLEVEPVVVAEAGLLGVPALVPQGDWHRTPGRVEVAEPERVESWAGAISAVLDDPTGREQLSFEAAAAAGALQRPAA